jgi:hypothetical protein
MFENGDAEMWCNWRIKFDDIIGIAPLVTADQKINAALTFFKEKELCSTSRRLLDPLMLPSTNTLQMVDVDIIWPQKESALASLLARYSYAIPWSLASR